MSFSSYGQFWVIYLLTAISCSLDLQAQLPKEASNTSLTYYGTGCFLIERNGVALLTDPFIDNPGLGQLLFGKCETDTAYVNRYLDQEELGRVRMTIAGHAHYDHLMDLPYLAQFIPQDAVTCSNRTAKHILGYFDLLQPFEVMNPLMGTDSTLGDWVHSQDSTLRCMAFKSMHPPQVMGLHLMRGRYTEDLTEKPDRMGDWVGGTTLSFLVDWLEDGKPVHRIFFLSSMASAPFGLFPEKLLKEHPVNDLFIGASLIKEYEEFPGPVIDLTQPKRIFLIHWENFFRSKEKDPRALKKQALKKMEDQVRTRTSEGTIIIIPEPLNRY